VTGVLESAANLASPKSETWTVLDNKFRQ